MCWQFDWQSGSGFGRTAVGVRGGRTWAAESEETMKMKRFVQVMLGGMFAVALAAFLAGCAAPAADSPADGKEIDSVFEGGMLSCEGGKMIVVLDANATTGYEWKSSIEGCRQGCRRRVRGRHDLGRQGGRRRRAYVHLPGRGFGRSDRYADVRSLMGGFRQRQDGCCQNRGERRCFRGSLRAVGHPHASLRQASALQGSVVVSRWRATAAILDGLGTIKV